MPIIKHKNPFGGDAGNRTRVHNAFATKELQQYRYYTTHLFMCQPDPTHHHVLTKRGNYKINKNTMATTTIPMAKL